jgi:hypothetical protein
MGSTIVHVVVHVTQGLSWVQIGAPIAALAAAAASWRSASIARQSQISADQPQLVFHVLGADPSEPVPLVMKLENVGRGVAILPGFFLATGDGQGVSTVLDRNLSHGEISRSGIPFETQHGARGIAFCEDRYNNVHVWSADRNYRQYRKNKRRQLTVRQMMKDLYGVDPGEVALVPSTPLPALRPGERETRSG